MAKGHTQAQTALSTRPERPVAALQCGTAAMGAAAPPTNCGS